MGWIWTIVGGLVMGGLASWSATHGGWGFPGWTLPALGLVGTLAFAVAWVSGRIR
jgi:uncharacterized membrane protein YeaQ/YmgE (transglycosylase-associated protein family)